MSLIATALVLAGALTAWLRLAGITASGCPSEGRLGTFEPTRSQQSPFIVLERQPLRWQVPDQQRFNLPSLRQALAWHNCDCILCRNLPLQPGACSGDCATFNAAANVKRNAIRAKPRVNVWLSLMALLCPELLKRKQLRVTGEMQPSFRHWSEACIFREVCRHRFSFYAQSLEPYGSLVWRAQFYANNFPEYRTPLVAQGLSVCQPRR